MDHKIVLIDEDILKDTANALREKEGSSVNIRPVDFAKKIEELENDNIDTELAEYTELLARLEKLQSALPEPVDVLEQCVVTIDGTYAEPEFAPKIYYLNSLGEVINYNLILGEVFSYNTLKNRILILKDSPSYASYSGEIDMLLGYNNVRIFAIYGNCTIYC